MITYLIGTPIPQKNYLTILVNGVGYGVFVGSKTMASAANLDTIELHIYTHIKEDKLDLYGFKTEKQLSLFQLVLSVSGVGPKTALAIIDAGADRLVEGVQQANVGMFTPVPRVGKKLAQKIIIELKSKLGELKELDLGPRDEKTQNVYEALESLGFDQSSIENALNQIDIENTSVEEAIKIALKKTNS